MKPYYQEDGITIYHGDCREILPQLEKVDLVLTDPPYGIGEDGGKCRTRGKATPNHPCGNWDSEIPPRETFEAMKAISNNQTQVRQGLNRTRP